MCSPLRSLLATLAILSVVGTAPLTAQMPLEARTRDRALLARAESLLTWSVAKDSALLAARRVAWRARLAEAGGLVLAVPSVVPADDARRSLDSARSLLNEFGGIPEAFSRSLLIYSARALDTGVVLGTPALRARVRVLVGLVSTDTLGNWTVDSWDVAQSVMRAYRESRHSEWRDWLPADFGLGGWNRAAAWLAYDELTASPWSVGAHCVEGDLAGCRLWLGIDRDSAPYSMRYTVAELRNYFSSRSWFAWRSDRGVACLNGEDAACVEMATLSQRPMIVPAEVNRATKELVSVLFAAVPRLQRMLVIF